MKKYLVIIVLLLFGKAEAQKKYPIIKYDTVTTIAHYGDSAVVTRTSTKTVIDSEITVYYHGMPCVTSTKVTEYTTLVSKKLVTISKEVATKFELAQSVIDEYLQYGKQTANSCSIVSLTHGFLDENYVLYIKNNTLYYKNQYTSGDFGSVVFFLLTFSSLLLFDLILLRRIPWKKGKIGYIVKIFTCVGIGTFFEFLAFKNSFHVWDEAVIPPIISLIVFFLTTAYISYQDNQQEYSHGSGGN